MVSIAAFLDIQIGIAQIDPQSIEQAIPMLRKVRSFVVWEVPLSDTCLE